MARFEETKTKTKTMQKQKKSGKSTKIKRNQNNDGWNGMVAQLLDYGAKGCLLLEEQDSCAQINLTVCRRGCKKNSGTGLSGRGSLERRRRRPGKILLKTPRPHNGQLAVASKCLRVGLLCATMQCTSPISLTCTHHATAALLALRTSKAL